MQGLFELGGGVGYTLGPAAGGALYEVCYKMQLELTPEILSMNYEKKKLHQGETI